MYAWDKLSGYCVQFVRNFGICCTQYAYYKYEAFEQLASGIGSCKKDLIVVSLHPEKHAVKSAPISNLINYLFIS